MSDGVVTWTISRIQLINALREQRPPTLLVVLGEQADQLLDTAAAA